MFKPEESFASCERIDGKVNGWRRVWAQRSCDHRWDGSSACRSSISGGFLAQKSTFDPDCSGENIFSRGVPHQPGLVCTVLSDEELAELGLRTESDPPSVTHGVAYRIPDDQAQSGERPGYRRRAYATMKLN